MSSKTQKWVPILIAIIFGFIVTTVLIKVLEDKSNPQNQKEISSVKIVQFKAPPGFITPNKEKAGEAVSYEFHGLSKLSFYDSDGNFKVCFYDGSGEIYRIHEFIQDGSASVNYLNYGK